MDWLIAEHAALNVPVLQPPQQVMPIEPGSKTILLSAHLLRGSSYQLPVPSIGMKEITPSYALWAYELCKTVEVMRVLGVYCTDEDLVWLKTRPRDEEADPLAERMRSSAHNVVELGPRGLLWMGHFGDKEARVSTELMRCETLAEIAHASSQPWSPQIATPQLRQKITASIDTLRHATAAAEE